MPGGRLSLSFLLSHMDVSSDTFLPPPLSLARAAQALSPRARPVSLEAHQVGEMPDPALDALAALQALFASRFGLLWAEAAPQPDATEPAVRALELELSAVGYALSARLRARLLAGSVAQLRDLHRWLPAALDAHRGGGQKHIPLFRRFPEDIPTDTTRLWWQKHLIHYLQQSDQPCILCGHRDTLHILNPCTHTICARCFDGSNYSACPVCEQAVDRESPFFKEAPQRQPPAEAVRFQQLDLGPPPIEQAQRSFAALCAREQPLSPDDRTLLSLLVRTFPTPALDGLPPSIPVRENVAIILGALLHVHPLPQLMPALRAHLKTATDLLRLIAAYSGADVSLTPTKQSVIIPQSAPLSPHWPQAIREEHARRQLAGRTSPPSPDKKRPATPGGQPQDQPGSLMFTLRSPRFKKAPLPRALRRFALAFLDALPEAQLFEDVLRHQRAWIWVGESLHPFEYKKRYPRAAAAFQLVRGVRLDDQPPPTFRSWAGRVQRALDGGALTEALDALTQRPGEFARRLDVLLSRFTAQHAQILERFAPLLDRLPVPMLATLRAHFSTRHARLPARLYWPKGQVALGVIDADLRPTLPEAALRPLLTALDGALLQKFEASPAFEWGLLDEALREIVAPFNERTASPAAIALPRGSRIRLPEGKLLRLFLHWCEPQGGRSPTDLDLSVALYSADWRYLGVCSYYNLTCHSEGGEVIARSAGDLRSAPWPDGASEFVDVHRASAQRAQVRYAVAVVNSYSGLSFDQLERAFAGVMLRDDEGGAHFDARTVQLRFNLQGSNGIYLPFVVDLEVNRLHWLDVHTPGQLSMNNVERSKNEIQRICPAMIASFEAGARPNLYEIGLLQLAARCDRVAVRGEQGGTRLFERAGGETRWAFYERLRGGPADSLWATATGISKAPALALLYRGDLVLPEGSLTYTLFWENQPPQLSASDLLKG